MSLKTHKTIVLKIKKKEYELLMYIRREKIELERFSPGSLVFHFDNQSIARKHELHYYKTGNKAEETAGDIAKETAG